MTSLRPGQWLTIALLIMAFVVVFMLLTGFGLPHSGSPIVGPLIAP